MASVDDAVQTMIRNLEDKTGKSLAEWVTIARASARTKHRELLSFLKTEQGLTHGYANLIALRALADDVEPGDVDLVAAQYDGAKAPLRGLYEMLIAAVKEFGDDVEISAKKAYVSLRRKKQFAIVQPSTATRLDLGLNLKGAKQTDRLRLSGSFNAMVSHRVRMATPEDLDQELINWLRAAYDAAG
jgi:hypothetical protein